MSFSDRYFPLSVAFFDVVVVNIFHILFFSRNTDKISTKLVSLGEGIQVYSNEGPRYFPREDNKEIVT